MYWYILCMYVNIHTYIRTYIHTYIYMYWHATHHTPVCHPGRRPDSDCGRWSRFDGRQLKSFKRCETSLSFDFDHPCEVSRCANVTKAWVATKKIKKVGGVCRFHRDHGLWIRMGWIWNFGHGFFHQSPRRASSQKGKTQYQQISTDSTLKCRMEEMQQDWFSRNGSTWILCVEKGGFPRNKPIKTWRKGLFKFRVSFPLSRLSLGSTQTGVDSARCPAHDYDSKLLATLCYKFSTDGKTWKRF